MEIVRLIQAGKILRVKFMNWGNFNWKKQWLQGETTSTGNFSHKQKAEINFSSRDS